LNLFRTKFITSKTNGFIANIDTPFNHQVLDVAVTQVESMVKPYGILDNFRRESMTLVY
jgi:hypothetical protein